MSGPAVQAIIAEVEAEMACNGRILVRASGTEPLVRVMAEAPTQEACDAYVERIANVVRENYALQENQAARSRAIALLLFYNDFRKTN
jgi:phosphoglucosamine mutase